MNPRLDAREGCRKGRQGWGTWFSFWDLVRARRHEQAQLGHGEPGSWWEDKLWAAKAGLLEASEEAAARSRAREDNALDQWLTVWSPSRQQQHHLEVCLTADSWLHQRSTEWEPLRMGPRNLGSEKPLLWFWGMQAFQAHHCLGLRC